MKKIMMSFGMIGAMILLMITATTVLGDVFGNFGFLGGEVYAADNLCDDAGIDKETRRAAGCKVDGEGVFGDKKKTAVPIVLNVMNAALSLAGTVAVIVIVYGGILYVTSTGDTSRTTKAKNCILYGIVGLVVAVMAFAIVSFVNVSVLKK